MDFSWSDEQHQLRESTVRFAKRELNVELKDRDRSSSFSLDLWHKCAGFGIQGLCVPEAYGGRGLDVLTTIYMLEGLGYGCRDNGLTLALNGQIWSVQEPLMRFGTEEQKQKYLPGLCRGELLAAHGMTEPETGSDAFALTSTAQRCDGGYLLNGSKTLIGLGPVADLTLVFASTNPEHQQWGVSAFLVESSTPGYSIGASQEKMGLRTAPMGELHFQDCLIPESNRLGPEGAGVSIFNHSMEWERSFIFASHVGSMQRQLEEAIAFAQQRQQFGQPIGKFQSVSNRIADMRLRLETARLLLYKLAWEKGRRQSVSLEAAMAKLHLSEAFVASSFDALRIHGGRGFVTEGEVERDLRDALGGVIYSGTSDIQRVLIAKLLGL